MTRTDWTVDRPLRPHELVAELAQRAGWDAVATARVLRHGGIHVDRRRLAGHAADALLPVGAAVVAYALHAEPAGVELSLADILLDEEGVVAVNKPPWLTVQGSRATRLMAVEWQLRRLLACAELTPAHRLDRETSGVLLFARHREAASALGRQFQSRRIEKRYLAVVSPPPPAERWDVAGRLVRISHPAHSLFALRPPGGEEGVHSRGRFERLAVAGGRALVRALPLTGRTHQVRVHLAASGCPIAGDSLYGEGYRPGHPGGAVRLLLHAESLAFRLPSGRPVTVEAPVPSDLATALPGAPS